MTAVSNDLDFEFEVTYDDMPTETPKAGATSQWDPLIEAARTEAVAAAKARPPRRAPDGGSPWIAYPKKGKDGKRAPVVGTSNLYNLRSRLGGPTKTNPKGSEHYQKTGEFFEFEVTDRVKSGEKGTSQKGVLWVRRGTAKS